MEEEEDDDDDDDDDAGNDDDAADDDDDDSEDDDEDVEEEGEGGYSICTIASVWNNRGLCSVLVFVSLFLYFQPAMAIMPYLFLVWNFKLLSPPVSNEI